MPRKNEDDLVFVRKNRHENAKITHRSSLHRSSKHHSRSNHGSSHPDSYEPSYHRSSHGSDHGNHSKSRTTDSSSRLPPARLPPAPLPPAPLPPARLPPAPETPMPFEVSRYEEWPEEQGWERYAPPGSSAQPAAAPYTMSGAVGPATTKSPIIINASPGKPHYVQAKDPAPTPVIHHAQPWDTDARSVYGYPPDNSGGDRYAYDDAYRDDRYADNNAYRPPYPASDSSVSGENRYLSMPDIRVERTVHYDSERPTKYYDDDDYRSHGYDSARSDTSGRSYRSYR